MEKTCEPMEASRHKRNSLANSGKFIVRGKAAMRFRNREYDYRAKGCRVIKGSPNPRSPCPCHPR